MAHRILPVYMHTPATYSVLLSRCGRTARHMFLRIVPALALLSTSACVSVQPIEEREASRPMDPIELPEWKAGTEVDMMDVRSGEPTGFEIAEVTSDGMLNLNSKRTSDVNGCSWTNRPDWFSPPSSWTGCGTGKWASGTNEVTLLSGNLWPLKAGAKASYRKVPRSSTGETGTTEIRKCEVFGPVAVTASFGDVDAMKVVCKTRRWDNNVDTRTWYWTEENRNVKYRKTSTKDGLVDDSELVLLSQ